MCLITKYFFPKISFRKIQIYKVVILKDNGDLRTPYQNTKLMKRAKGIFFFPEKYCDDYFIYGGMIHAFVSRYDALDEKQYIVDNRKISDQNVKIIIGYIPPFTRYYISEDGVEICAKRMKYEISD